MFFLAGEESKIWSYATGCETFFFCSKSTADGKRQTFIQPGSGSGMTERRGGRRPDRRTEMTDVLRRQSTVYVRTAIAVNDRRWCGAVCRSS